MLSGNRHLLPYYYNRINYLHYWPDRLVATDTGMLSDLQVNFNWGQMFSSTYMNVFIMVNILLG
jgi:hypothetical protein